MNTQYTITLTYANGSTFLTGGFNSEAEAQAWITNEQSQPYWAPTTTAIIASSQL